LLLAQADQTNPATTESSRIQGTQTQTQRASQAGQGQLVDVSQIHDKKVTDAGGGEIGKLERVLIDSKSGRARYAVVQVDKSWNLNDPEVIVPWGAMEIRKLGAENYQVILDVTKEKLLKAPRFDVSKLDQLGNRQVATPIYTYWAVIWVDDPEGSSPRRQTASDRGSQPGASGTSSTTPTSPAGSSATGTTTQPAGQPDQKATTNPPKSDQ
jgi:sporulation protein YlmC with PRC-barrel domain